MICDDGYAGPHVCNLRQRVDQQTGGSQKVLKCMKPTKSNPTPTSLLTRNQPDRPRVAISPQDSESTLSLRVDGDMASLSFERPPCNASCSKLPHAIALKANCDGITFLVEANHRQFVHGTNNVAICSNHTQQLQYQSNTLQRNLEPLIQSSYAVTATSANSRQSQRAEHSNRQRFRNLSSTQTN